MIRCTKTLLVIDFENDVMQWNEMSETDTKKENNIRMSLALVDRFVYAMRFFSLLNKKKNDFVIKMNVTSNQQCHHVVK